MLGARHEQRRIDLGAVLAVPRKGDLLAMRFLRYLLQCLAPDEIMIELDERAVAQFIRSHIVVFDILGDEASADRPRTLVAAGGQPLAVFPHLLAGVNSRQRRWNPSGLQCIAGVGARSHRHQIEFAPSFEYRVAYFIALGVGAPHFQPGRARHAVPQGAYLSTLDVDRVHGEEFDVGNRAAVELLQHFGGIRPLDLVAIVAPRNRLAARMRGRAIVADHVHLEAAGLAVKLDPVHRRRAADEQQFVLVEIEQDAVADDVAVVTDRHHLLRLVHGEVIEAVDGGM